MKARDFSNRLNLTLYLSNLQLNGESVSLQDSALKGYDTGLVGCLGLNGPLRQYFSPFRARGWSGGAMVLGKLPVPGRPTVWIPVGQGPIALAVGAGGGGLDIFTLIYPFSSFSLSLGDGPI